MNTEELKSTESESTTFDFTCITDLELLHKYASFVAAFNTPEHVQAPEGYAIKAEILRRMAAGGVEKERAIREELPADLAKLFPALEGQERAVRRGLDGRETGAALGEAGTGVRGV